MIGLGNNLDELKAQIKKAKEELAQIDLPESPMPEMIDTTNILRANERLTKIDRSKTSLISAYDEYAKKLEDLVVSLLSIQADLKDIVQTEASIIKGTRKKPKKITRKKSKK